MTRSRLIILLGLAAVFPELGEKEQARSASSL
jgi:hypothetical protein